MISMRVTHRTSNGLGTAGNLEKRSDILFAMIKVATLFEAELRRRHLSFSIEQESGRYALEIGGGRMLVSLENLERDYCRDEDVGRVSRFVDAIQSSAGVSDDSLSAERLYWCLEPNSYEDAPDFRAPISDRVDRALMHFSADGKMISWVTPAMLDTLGLMEIDAGAKAFANLARALAEATIETSDIDGVQLGIIDTKLAFKASLILAPNLREVVAAKLGWPVMAVAPDRDFLYLWADRHAEFVQRVGGVVVDEYSQASYPLSTEVYKISDQGIKAVGEFPVREQR